MDGILANPFYFLIFLIILLAAIGVTIWLTIKYRRANPDWNDSKHKVQSMQGGILFIVAGAFMSSLHIPFIQLASELGVLKDFNWDSFIVSLIFIGMGVRACYRMQKRELIGLGVTALAICALHLFELWILYGLGYFQMILLVIGAIFFFTAPRTKTKEGL